MAQWPLSVAPKSNRICVTNARRTSVGESGNLQLHVASCQEAIGFVESFERNNSHPSLNMPMQLLKLLLLHWLSQHGA